MRKKCQISGIIIEKQRKMFLLSLCGQIMKTRRHKVTRFGDKIPLNNNDNNS